MSNIESVINVQISRDTRAVSREGFGTPILVGPNAAFAEAVRSYSDIAAVQEDFSAADPETVWAASVFAQNPSPILVKIAKRLADVAQVENVEVTTVLNTTLYRVTINGENFDYTSDADATAAEIRDGLIAAINDGAQPVTAAIVDGTNLSLTSDTAGLGFSLSVSAELTESTTTENRNAATQLTELEKTDDDWYAIFETSHSKKDVLDLAAFAEPRKKLYFFSTAQAEAKNASNVQLEEIMIDVVANTTTYAVRINSSTFTFVSSGAATDAEIQAGLVAAINLGAEPVTAAPKAATTDQITITADVADVPFSLLVNGALMSTTVVTDVDLLKRVELLNYFRTVGCYHETPAVFPEAAWAGKQLPTDPGSTTWMYKSVAGIPASPLSTTEKTAIVGTQGTGGKNGNIYVEIGGVDVWRDGKVAGGEFIDIMRGVDWLESRMEERILQRQVNSPKIPFTQPGIETIAAEVRAQLLEGQAAGLIAPGVEGTDDDAAFFVDVPDINSIPTSEKLVRTLNSLSFTAKLAGAIHFITISGNVTV